MSSNECIPFKGDAEDLTCQATGAITGKRLVKISANRQSGPALNTAIDGSNYLVAQCVAGEGALGVAKYDAASGAKVGVITAGIVPITAGSTITYFQEVMADVNGKVVPYAAGAGVFAIGRAMTGAASAADAEIKLYQ
jgi:hypothetical protein